MKINVKAAQAIGVSARGRGRLFTQAEFAAAMTELKKAQVFISARTVAAALGCARLTAYTYLREWRNTNGGA